LQEQGVYAAVLYLYAKEKETGDAIAEALLGLAAKVTGQVLPNPGPADEGQRRRLQYVTDHVASSLQTLVLVKQLWEQALIYARYACKL
jgi:hypothetical protein